ncbi:cardiolipin synthase [Paracoccus sp. p4-l81]|uniref:cardiolipin synthase n=1 Tax=unclassified Paracoccus (in: a-proteobacteria) TaxID=2688777 RepID=UPI0035B91730
MPAMVATLFVLLVYAAQLGVVVRVLLRPQLGPVARLAWVLMVAAIPLVGMIVYLLFGEVRLRRAKAQKMADVRKVLFDMLTEHPGVGPVRQSHPAFAAGRATSGFRPLPGNRALILDEHLAMEDVIDAIDEARDHVHVLFYIWLPDGTGTRFAMALMAAARRGVTCRVLVDDLGSRALIGSALWADMAAAGVRLARAFPVGNPLVAAVLSRIDLRNHRKIVVVDNAVTWIGSRNCADPAFRPKQAFGPWVDVQLRVEGPVVRQHQAVFLQDWMMYADEDVGALLDVVPPLPGARQVAQVIASGPDQSQACLSTSMAAMMYGAQRRLTITTPYYVPNVSLHTAICAAALRGVDTTLIVPARNDSLFVAAAAESLFGELADCGVRLMAYEQGLIHAKIMTVDGRLAMVGSANLDQRSFDLNYENNILFDAPDLTAALDERQALYMSRSRLLTPSDIAGWSWLRRIRNNLFALAGPLL